MNPLDNYEKIRQVGKGAFGIAVLYRKKSTNQHVVIKEINTIDLSAEEREMALNEVEVLSSLHHPSIIGYGGSFVVEGVLMIEMEYADGGTLSQLLSNRRDYFPEREILELLRQISSAIAHMHANNILHRDLKTANVFMNTDGSVKIGDFGISKVLSTNAQAQTVLGTPYYISPEMCEGKDYNEKSDIWAMGCILYEICCLHRTFQASSLSALVNKIMQGSYKPVPPGYSKELSNLVSDLLDKNPDNRPTAKEVHDKKIQIILTALGPEGYKYMDPHLTNSGQLKQTKIERSVLYEMKFLKNATDIQPIQLPPKIKINDVSIGADHYIAVTDEGKVFTWGNGEKGQLGIGEIKSCVRHPLQIVSIRNKNVVMVTAGKEFSIFLTKEGTILSCGDGSNGVLGHGDWKNCYEPKIITTLIGRIIKAISCSANHVAALETNGTVYAWGCGKKGQTGHGILQNSCLPIPIKMHDKYEITSLYLGYDASMIVTSKGILYACGYNVENKLALIRQKMFKKSTKSSLIYSIFEKVHISGEVINCSIGKTHCAIVVKLSNGKSLVYTTGSLNSSTSKKLLKHPVKVTQMDDVHVKMIKCGPTYTLVGTEDNCIMLWGMQYRMLEHTININKDSQESSGIWSQPSIINSMSSCQILGFSGKVSQNYLTYTYTPQIILDPIILLALYASPQQIDNGSFMLLNGIYPLPYGIMFLVKTNVALSKRSDKINDNMEVAGIENTMQDFDTIGPIPSWMKVDIALSKHTWPGY